MSHGDIENTVQAVVTARSDDLRELSLFIWENPELAYKEHLAHDRLTQYLRAVGFEVEEHYVVPTAFRATFARGTSSKIFGLNSEYDALPGIGHACGHNLIAIGGVAAAIGLREAMIKHDIEGTIVLLGTPAEEGGAGKVKLLEAGAYEGMDACMMLHPAGLPTGLDGAIGVTSAIQSIAVEYYGKEAHAAASPWDGINALDAAVVAYSSVSAMRQQLKVTDRVHGIIEKGGDAPNIIPQYTRMKFYVRAAHVAALERLKAKIMPCFNAAATATGCTVKITTDVLTNDLRNCPTLSLDYAAIMKRMYGTRVMIQTKPSELSGGSTDFGNISYALPACHPLVGIPSEPGHGNHTPGFTACTKTVEAHGATLQASVAMAVIGANVLREEDYARKARATWSDTIEAVTYET